MNQETLSGAEKNEMNITRVDELYKEIMPIECIRSAKHMLPEVTCDNAELNYITNRFKGIGMNYAQMVSDVMMEFDDMMFDYSECKNVRDKQKTYRRIIRFVNMYSKYGLIDKKYCLQILSPKKFTSTTNKKK